MKTIRSSRRNFVFLLIAAAGMPLGAVAAEAGAPPPKAVLFMGADLMLQHKKKLYRVEDVAGSDFKIRVAGEDVFVPTSRDPVNLHIDAELKLAGLTVQVDGLKAGEGYTYGNDPMRKLEEANRNSLVTADLKDYAEAAVPRAEGNLQNVMKATSHYTDRAQADREVATAIAGVAAANRMSNYTDISVNSDSSNLGSGAHRMAIGQGQFDAMEVSFKVSSPVELKQPYMVILFKFHDPAAKPDVNGMAIHAQALDPIDAKPRYVRVLRGGLPTGFKFVECSVHIYDHGREVATNISNNRVELAHSEAREYLVLQHVSAHKGATLPAAIVPGTLSRTRRENLSGPRLTRAFYVKVSGAGAVEGAFEDFDCKQPLEDVEMKIALDEVFFTPALEQGKVVDGVARVRFVDF